MTSIIKIMEDKKSIRQEVRRRIKLMSEAAKLEESEAVFSAIEAMPLFDEVECIALFAAMWDEVPTTQVLERWRKMGKRVVVPRVEGDIMRYYDYHPDRMTEGAFGIIEPVGDVEVAASDIDLMIVPARAFTPEGGTTAVVPLSYITGSLLYYIDGVAAASPTVTVGTDLTVSGINVPAGSTATLIYEVRVIEYAPLAAGSTIINRASVTGAQITEPTTDTSTVPVRASTDLTIAKALCPPTVAPDGTLSYTFIVQNTGNTAVVATEDAVITDTFDPILTDLAVTFNGAVWTEGVQYNYDVATGLFTTVPGQIVVPAATYTQDPVTGAYTVTPGIATLVVTGTI